MNIHSHVNQLSTFWLRPQLGYSPRLRDKKIDQQEPQKSECVLNWGSVHIRGFTVLPQSPVD